MRTATTAIVGMRCALRSVHRGARRATSVDAAWCSCGKFYTDRWHENGRL